MKTRVAIAEKMGDPFVIEVADLADPKENEVRIKVMTTTICHSDLHGVRGEHGPFEGCATAGHEIAGIIDAVGANVTYVKPGDRVLCGVVRAGCGYCENCLRGHSWFCENLPPVAFRAPGPYTRANGKVPIQTNLGATGFAEYTNAHESFICKIDDDIPYAVASAMACGFITGFGAILNRCQVKPGEGVAVIGCGGVGLSAIQGARVSGACPIIAIDVMENKLELAKKCGATHAVNAKNENPVEAVKAITKYGAEHVIIAVAGKGIKRQAFDIAAPWGEAVIIGHGRAEEEMLDDFNAMEFMQGKRFTGSVMGAVTLRRDIKKYMDMYRKGIIDIDCMLTNKFTLDQLNEAYADAESGALKNIVVIGGEA
ncbi:MAG: alcohol dehydrogenase catalytic domain-containing protein [Oscillospiraceae bacterium]|nr:alcohol dehydrogenase catalytic domain-containing protein [Oscillospiraceae bacterium]